MSTVPPDLTTTTSPTSTTQPSTGATNPFGPTTTAPKNPFGPR
jgi:hypothetical protein